MKTIKSIIILIIILAIILTVYFLLTISSPAGQESNLIYFRVESGQSVNEISANLKDQNLINNKLIFETYIWLKKSETKVLAGTHKLSSNMTVREVVETLTTGGSIDNEQTIIIIEGWRASEMGQYLESQRLVKKQEFIDATKISNWQDKYDFLVDLSISTVEGFLFPDTYRIFTDATAGDIVDKMLGTFDQKLTSQMRSDIVSQGKSIYEIIIMASIIEREARTDEDKKMVADVFWKRIVLGMPLQSDATVNYATGKSLLRPTNYDLEVDSPYNTYKYAGLPLGPISNPGLMAIEAAIYPKSNDYLFFLMDQYGQTHYASTFSGHQENVRKYLDNF
ncbi:MAG TPA: endolytic transglycosylase MltG [Patescibacteria group bacterium]|nr:endolytic transglycosylase MltG [Patescibacteria group bacterium]